MKVYRIFILAVISVIISASAVHAQVTPGDPGNFITTWNTGNFGSSSNTEIEIPTTGSGYNYDVYWEEVGNTSNNGTINGNTGDLTIDFLSEGIYRVEIAGDFPRIHFNFGGDRQKILTVEQWGDIEWTSMEDAFNGCTNLTIPATDAPDLSGVTNMEAMFRWATSLNNNIEHWNVSNVENMQDLFNFATVFDQPLNSWNVEKVTKMRQMFANAGDFNQDLNGWDVSKVTDMRSMFKDASSFNGNISNWMPELVTDMSSMFEGARDFNQDINGWDVSSVENMQSMFSGAFDFNQDLNDWDVSNVESMRDMFRFASSFDGDISNWDVSSVTDMHSMFSSAGDFNQDLSTKTVNAGTAEEYTAWDVSGVTIVNSMFQSADSFNQDLSSWDVSGFNNFGGMFSGADEFNQDLSAWDISGAEFMQNMLNNTGLSTENYDNTLIGWAAQAVQSGVTLGATGLTYCNASAERQSLIDSPNNWTINDAGVATDCTAPSSPDVFVTTWETNISGSPTITIPIEGTGYNFSIDWGDGNSTNWQDGDPIGDLTHTYASAGTYKVEIDGDFPRIYFNNSGDRRKILTVEQWGTIEWSSMEYAFYGAENLEIVAEDTPDLSNVTSIKGMFRDADSMNHDINNWDTGNVEDMSELFMRALAFNQPLNNWNTEMVTTMASMFEDAEAFNQDLDNWDVRKVEDMSSMFKEAENFNGALNAWAPESATNMQSMFEDAEEFNQPIDGWDTGSVENMAEMFRDAENFNQDLDSWDVSMVEDMSDMFRGAAEFNGDITDWNTESVMDISGMFLNAENFNQDLSEKTVNFGAPDEYRAWVLSNVTDMNSVFLNAEDFDHDISDWSTENVESMASMFRGASSFNQDIGEWDTGEVTNMTTMFLDATSFDQDLGNWDIAGVTSFSGESDGMFGNTDLSTANYDSLLIGWAAQTVQSGINFDAAGLTYCEGADARQELIDPPNNWTFTGDALAGGCVLPQVVSASNSEVTATTPHTADGVDESTVTVVLRDEEDDAISGFTDADFLIEVTGSATASEIIETGTPGTYSFTVTDAVEEIVTVTVTADGTELDDEPTIDFEAPPQVVSASNSEVTATTPHTADGVDESTVTVVLRDEEDDAISGFTDADFLIEVTGSATASEISETGTPGTYSFTVTDAVEEIVTVTVTADGTELDDKPTIDFEAPVQVVDPADSEVTATTPHIADGVDTSTVTVVLKDDAGDPISGFTNADFLIELTGSGVASEVTETGTAGTYRCTVTDTIAEIVTVTVTAGGTELDDQPDIEFQAPEQVVDAENSKVTATTPHIADGTDQATVIVVLRDEEDDPIGRFTPSDFLINVTGSASATEINETESAGTYQFNVINSVAEMVTVTVTADGVELDDKPEIDFESPEQIVDGDASEVTVTSPHIADGEDASTVKVKILDQEGEPISGLTDDDFDISVKGDAEASGFSETKDPGVYIFEITSKSAGTVVLSITVKGVELKDTEQIVFEAPEVFADPDLSEVTATSPHTADGEDASVVTITLRDEDGELISGFTSGQFSVDLSRNAEASNVSETGNEGVYSFTVVSKEEGNVTVTVTVKNVELDDQPTILFEAPIQIVDAFNSEVTATSPHLADGEDASTVTVTLRDDENESIIERSTDEFSVDLTGSASAGPIKETEPGIYQFDVTNEVVEIVTVTVSVSGVELNDQPKIQYEKVPDPVPEPPAIISLEGDADNVEITWESQFEEFIDRYRIYRGVSIQELIQIGEIPAGTFQFVDSSPQGTTIYYAVSAVNRDGVEGQQSDPVTFFNSAIVAEQAQWKLVSNPLQNPVQSSENVTLFSYSNQYVQEDQLEAARGYWIKSKTFDSEVLSVSGSGLTERSIELQEGWNLIGSLSAPIQVESIADESGILTSVPVFGFSGSGYEPVETLNPNEGYWIFADGDGEILLNINPENSNGQNQIVTKLDDFEEGYPETWIEFSREDQTRKLWIVNQASSSYEEQQYMLPPKAPGGTLDVRTGKNLNLISSDRESIWIESDTFPIQVTLKGMPLNSDFIWRLVYQSDGAEKVLDLIPDKAVQLAKEYDRAELVKVNMDEVITEHKLLPNYPNPFNPSTTIQYQLHEQVPVQIAVYDVTGKRVQMLANKVQPTGFYRIQFDGGRFSSGVYFIRFIAGSESQVQKITLIK